MEKQGRYLRREYGDRRSILTTWMISFEQVASESEEAANLLKLWGLLDHKDLWYGLFASVCRKNDNFEVPKWLAVLAESELEFNSVTGLLRRYSLIDASGQQTESHTIHAVLHAWCYHISAGDEQRSMLLLAMNIVAQAVPDKSDSAYWTMLRRLLPHGLHVYEKMSVPQRRQDWTLFVMVNVPAWTSHELGRLFAAQVKSSEGEAMYERALAGYEKALGPEHTSTLMTVNNLRLLHRKRLHLHAS